MEVNELNKMNVVAQFNKLISQTNFMGADGESFAGILEKQDLRLQTLFCCAQAYAFMAVKNRCMGWLRMKQRMRARYDNMCMRSHDAVDYEEPQSAMEYKELESRIRNAVKSLKGRRRQLFLPNREEGCRNADIASRIGI